MAIYQNGKEITPKLNGKDLSRVMYNGKQIYPERIGNPISFERITNGSYWRSSTFDYTVSSFNIVSDLDGDVIVNFDGKAPESIDVNYKIINVNNNNQTVTGSITLKKRASNTQLTNDENFVLGNFTLASQTNTFDIELSVGDIKINFKDTIRRL